MKKYLDILATDDESIPDLNQYYQSHQDELLRLISILNPKGVALLDNPDTFDDDEKSLELNTSKQSSQKSYPGDLSIYQDDYVAHKSLKHLSEDQIDLNRLLNREYPPDSAGPLKTIRKIKENLFTKKFTKRSRSSVQDDQISLKSTSSDTSRISLTDIKKEIKKIKKFKVKKLLKVENKQDEGYGMASILARSVIHADRSLAKISEHQDSEASPSSTLRRTSESEPVLGISDDESNENKGNVVGNIPEIHCSSLENMKCANVEPERKKSESCPPTPTAIRSDNLLKLPGDVAYFGSVSSALSAESSEIYSSSDEDDESSGMKSDIESTLETTSSVVQSVLSHDVNLNFVAQMERKLTDLELSKLEAAKNKNKEHNVIEPDKKDVNKSICGSEKELQKESPNKIEPEIVEATTSKDHKCVTKSNSHTIKIHNPFAHKKASKSISAPSSPIEKKGFMYRSSKRIKRQISKISKSSMIKSLSHYSLLPKKKHVDPKTPLSQPASASDVASKAASETVLGSPFLSYTDLMSLDKDGFNSLNRLHKSDEIISPNKVSMYIGSEPVSRASLSGPSSMKDEHHFHEQKSFKKEKSRLKPTGLLHTAIETILIDKVDTLLLRTSPDPNNQDQKFFADVNKKLEKVEEAQIKDHTNEAKKLKENETKHRQLVRQDSIRSTTDSLSSKMSKDTESNVIPCKSTHTPVLQHFHPILSGAPLESIPSLPEGSVDRAESLDVEGVVPTNSVSVCCNSHAACGVDRSERDKCDRDKDKDKGSPRHARHESYGGREPVVTTVQNASLNSSSTPMGIHRRSSDSDLSVTPKGQYKEYVRQAHIVRFS